MYKTKKIIGIIPARSGSKGVKDKNIKTLAGKPLISYTIECAKATGIFDDIVVSTDSSKYADIAMQYGASVPFFRSQETASDSANSISVLEEVLNNLQETYDIVVMLQPTSPLRQPFHIKEAVDLFLEKNADSVVSVSKFPHSIAWVNSLDESLSMNGFIKKEYLNKRRQDLPQMYMLNGAVYVFKASMINKDFNMFDDKSFAYIMDKEYSIDIDDEYDFKLAEAFVGWK